MEIFKNKFFLAPNKMDNELNKLNKLEGKIFQAIEAITAKKRKGKGWFAKALSKAYKLVKSMGYNIPYGRNKQYADDLVNIYLNQAYLDNSIKIDKLKGEENMNKLLDGEDWKVSFEKAVDEKFEFTDKHIKKIFDKALVGKHVMKITTEDDGVYYLTVKSEDFENFKKLIKNYFTGDVITGEGSDSYSRLEGQTITGMSLVKLTKPQRKKTKGGGSKRKAVGWFPYLNGSDLDLTRYQIFSENDDNEDVSCLLHSLKLAGISETKLMEISSAVGNGIHITQSNLKLVCDVIEKTIIVRRQDGSSTRRLNKYGSKYEENDVITLGEVDGHFFINEETKYTGFYVKNMDALSEIDDDVKFSFTKKAERYKYGYRSLTPKFLSSLGKKGY